MSDGELLYFIFGCIAGFVIVGALILVNECMKAGVAPRRASTLKPS